MPLGEDPCVFPSSLSPPSLSRGKHFQKLVCVIQGPVSMLLLLIHRDVSVNDVGDCFLFCTSTY